MSINLSEENTIKSFGRQLLYENKTEYKSFEDAAQAACQQMYEASLDENGNPDFALVRIFRSCTGDQLPPEEPPKPADSYWFALAGTYGQEANWRDRRKSVGRRVTGFDTLDSSMLQEAFRQLNLDVVSYAAGETLEPTFTPETDTLYQIFHVEEALGSPYIVDQDKFVKPYGIKSALGIGCVFLSGAFYVCFAFSRKTITPEMAENFRVMSAFLSTFLAQHEDKGVLWS